MSVSLTCSNETMYCEAKVTAFFDTLLRTATDESSFITILDIELATELICSTSMCERGFRCLRDLKSTEYGWKYKI